MANFGEWYAFSNQALLSLWFVIVRVAILCFIKKPLHFHCWQQHLSSFVEKDILAVRRGLFFLYNIQHKKQWKSPQHTLYKECSFYWSAHSKLFTLRLVAMHCYLLLALKLCSFFFFCLMLLICAGAAFATTSNVVYPLWCR